MPAAVVVTGVVVGGGTVIVCGADGVTVVVADGALFNGAPTCISQR